MEQTRAGLRGETKGWVGEEEGLEVEKGLSRVKMGSKDVRTTGESGINC